MMDPATDQPPAAESPHVHEPDHQQSPNNPPPFSSVFALVKNASTGTTHHPHVRYIFSDDDPDVLTQALAEHDTSLDQSGSDPTLANRAMMLDLQSSADGGFSVAWSSSLSPSWAVVDAQLTRISPPSSEAGNGNNNGTGEGSNSRADRLMLKIEGMDSRALGSEAELRSGSLGRSGNGSTSGSGSGHKDRDRSVEVDDYADITDDFERRMATLRKVMNASEERRRKIGSKHEQAQRE
ncbi:hypothetical protein F5Y15DRAFT_315525 [Xylariaceae sp. FL0016]|nr:hypothetical protein F5Y15DRAFT_315525 [Xylariaceae sp. FL0016]